MQDYVWMTQYAQFFATCLSAVSAFIPVGHRSETSRIDRCFIALAAGTVTFLYWPTSLIEYCNQRTTFRSSALLFLLVAFIFLLAHLLLRDRLAHTQRVDDKSFVVLGSPILTPAARVLQRQHPAWTTQRIFEEQRYERGATWEATSRSLIVILDAAIYVVLGASMILTITALAAYRYSEHEVHALHHELTIIPNELTLGPSAGWLFHFDATGCERDVTWKLKVPSNVQAPGDLSSDGVYSAPAEVNHAFDVYVVASWKSEKEEKTATLHLVPKSGEVKQIVINGVDSNHRGVRFAVKVVNEDYSWEYKKYSLAGNHDGAALARELARSGEFNGFEEIICVGAASRELITPAAEDMRAMNRAAILASWVHGATESLHTPVYALKVGRYDAERGVLTPAETAGERRVVFIGASRHSDTPSSEAGPRSRY
jgi:hypothetical protein